MLLAAGAEPPFAGSGGVINQYVKRALSNLGYEVQVFPGEHRQRRVRHAESLIPLATVSLLHKVVTAPRPDLTFYDDLSLAVRAPVARSGHYNAVFFHGLRGWPGIAIANPAIDLYCCNSRYLARTLRSFMLLPDWSRGTVIDARGGGAVRALRLPVPLLDYPDGYPSAGDHLPAAVGEALEHGSILGHAVQREKPSPDALLSVMDSLNALAAEASTPGYRLVISQALVPELAALIENRPQLERDEAWGWFIPVPRLENPALITLLKNSRFGLCLNRIPESFGIYPLESILAGCPVYTNGIGNLRWLLPEDHGLRIYETEDGEHAVTSIAGRIHEDLQHEAATKAACARGAEYIAAEYTFSALETDLGAAIADLNTQEPSLGLADYRIELSPLVRYWNSGSGYVIADHRRLRLSERTSEILVRALGRRADDVAGWGNDSLDTITALLTGGVLALTELGSLHS
jgi:hypothetical protein